METTNSQWTNHALATLNQAGYRAGGARTAVVKLLGEHGCCLTAKEIVEQIERSGQQAGIASVYRALELLESLKLAQRIDTGEATARYEAMMPSGEHHHHVICEVCGKVSAFEDQGLEQALAKLQARLDYQVTGHEVSLRGLCADCQA